MSESIRVASVILVASLAFSGCTADEGSEESSRESRQGASEGETRDFVADSSIQIPPDWSYNVSRQGTDSWQFSISPFPFNLGRRCDRKTGPLVGNLFKRAEVFITGFGYVEEFPGAASRYRQTPGEFFLDDATLANYEGFCHPTYRMDFELDEYYVSVHVAVHKRAQDATVDQALEVLSSIR